MKNKNHNRNKNIKSLPKSTSHQKSKQKSKQKTKKFNPLEYLNALIQLTSNTNVLKGKHKKTNQKRDLSSALTTATPALSQTISSSKIRCKSSYSQYRKKCTTTNNLKQILNVNLNNYIITEQEDSTNCIKFTSISSAVNSNQQTPVGQNGLLMFKNHPQTLQLREHSRIIDYNYYATKIQQAWRSYQTYQMIKRYYKHFKRQTKYYKDKEQQQNQQHSKHVPLSESYRNYQKSQPKENLSSFQTHLNESQRKNNDDQLQKTIKFKIKSQQTSQHQQKHQKQHRIKRQNSSSSNSLNLTQKLNQLKQFVQISSPTEEKNHHSIKQIPTIEMIKGRTSHKENILNKSEKEQSQKCRKSDDSSTYKKNKKMKEKSQRYNKPIINNSQQKSSQSDNSISLVDNMIEKQTQKYNEILSLIQGCKSKEKQTIKTESILDELLSRLQKHKEELITSKQESVKVKKENNKSQTPIGFISQVSRKSNDSVLSFDSKDVYKQFEDDDFNTNQKNMDKKNLTQNNQSKQQQHSNKQDEQLRKESQKRIESLRRYYDLLSNESEKLQSLIHQSSERDNFCLQNIEPSSNEGTSNIYTESINSSQQNKSNKKLPDQIKPQQSWFYTEQDLESVYSFCSQTFSEDSAHKMFKEHMNLVELRRKKSIQNLEKLFAQNDGLSRKLYQSRMKQIQERFAYQSESISDKKEKYLKNLRSVKKEALQFQKQLIIDSKNQAKSKEYDSTFSNNKGSLSHGKLGIRKSFSAESIVLKCILKQPILKNREFKIDDYLIEKDDITDDKEEKKQNTVGDNKQPEIDHNQKFGTQLTKRKQCSFFVGEQVESVDDGNYNSGEEQSQQNNGESQQQQQQQSINKAQNDNNSSNDIECRQQSQSQGMGWSFQSMKDTQMFLNSLQRSQESQLSKSDGKDQRLSHKLLPIETEIIEDFQYNLTQQNMMSTEENLHYNEPLNQNFTHMAKVPSYMMQKCSQQLQKLIQSHLINELLQQIYLNDHLLHVFKPFIEEIYQFTPITDNMITDFAQQELKKHFPLCDELIRKANQKINPTSLEILRLVRDFDFEIDEYELILSQDIFRRARRHIELEYSQKITQRQNLPIKTYLTQNHKLSQKVNERQTLKRTKISKYMEYERDMKIMYMKAVFNCLNEFLIEQKSIATHVNTRSSIGTGELSMSIKQFNAEFDQQKVDSLFKKSYQRMERLLTNKCMLPVFKNYKEVSTFQQQMMRMIRGEFEETEYKWVTYMDEVLEIWDDVANWVVRRLVKQAVEQIGGLMSRY